MCVRVLAFAASALAAFATFALYALVTVYGLLAGSDTATLWPLYATSNGVGAVFDRVSAVADAQLATG